MELDKELKLEQKQERYKKIKQIEGELLDRHKNWSQAKAQWMAMRLLM